MTREEVIRLAKLAGIGTAFYGKDNEPLIEEIWGGPMQTALNIRFAHLVAAEEREACAAICDEHSDDPVYCGTAIRARGDSK